MTDGKYQKYPSYKKSGTVWLGEVPEHWDVLPTKRFFRLVTEPAPDNNDFELLSVYTEIGVKPRKDLEQKGNKASTTDGYWLVKKGDVVVNKLLAWMGAVGHSEYEGVTSPAYDILRPTRNFNSKFYHYLFRNEIAQQEFKRWSRGIMEMRLRLYFEELGRILMPFPPEEEMDKIANFLDHETAKIDTLIEKQQHLIKLLKEKRQALISHAVTKGLNPDVPMRDSGVEWLGEVPEHWVTCTLRHYADFEDGDRGNQYPNENDFKKSGVVFLSSKNIIDERLDLSEVKFISKAKFDVLNRGKAIDGDLIVKVRGSVGRIGELAKFQTSEHGYETAFINAQMMIMRTRKGLLTNYLRFISQSLYWTEQLAVGAYGTAQQQLSNDVFSQLNLAIPPLDEQLKIEAMLKLNLLKFNGLISKAKQAISLMQERRTALISAAVTGKIDIRSWEKA